MKNIFLWLRLRRRALPQAEQTKRREKVARWRKEAFGPITPETRAEDRQRLAEVRGGKGGLI